MQSIDEMINFKGMIHGQLKYFTEQNDFSCNFEIDIFNFNNFLTILTLFLTFRTQIIIFLFRKHHLFI
jgi:hypothetical protein